MRTQDSQAGTYSRRKYGRKTEKNKSKNYMMSWYSAERKKRQRRGEEGKIKKRMESKVDGLMDVFSPPQLLLTDQWRLRHVEAMSGVMQSGNLPKRQGGTHVHTYIHVRSEAWTGMHLTCGAWKLKEVLEDWKEYFGCAGRVFRLFWKE